MVQDNSISAGPVPVMASARMNFKIRTRYIDWVASVLVIIMLLLCSWVANAQRIAITPSVEKSVSGLHYGWGLNCHLGKSLQLGGFYQSIITRSNGDLQQDKVFYGATTSIALAKTDRMTFAVNARIGLINKDFLLVVPGCITDIQVSPRLHMLVGSAFRLGAPAFNAGLSYYLLN